MKNDPMQADVLCALFATHENQQQQQFGLGLVSSPHIYPTEDQSQQEDVDKSFRQWKMIGNDERIDGKTRWRGKVMIKV